MKPEPRPSIYTGFRTPPTRLGRVLSISTTGSDTVPSPVIPGASFAHRSAVPISAGTQQMTTSVVVVYQMKG